MKNIVSLRKIHIVCASLLIFSAILTAGCKGESVKTGEEDIEASQETEVYDSDKPEQIIVVNEAASDPDENVKGKQEEQGTAETGEEDSEMDKGSEEAFYITEITDDIFERIEGKSFKDDCTLDREDLRYLHVLNKDIKGEVHEGEMIVNVHIAEDVLEILKELYENDYPIEKIRLVDEYDADDELSMEDNNTSSFNFRFIPRTKKISKHGRGLAVDINPLYNPYITKSDSGLRIEPVNAGPYADRDKDYDYKIEKGDLCYELFISHGFEWGGEWKNSKDYQHFEIPTDKINEWYP